LPAQESAERAAIDNHQLDQQPTHSLFFGQRRFRPMIVAFDDQRRQEFLVFRQGHWIVGSNHQNTIVSLREVLPKQPDRFAKHSLDAVAPYRRPDATRYAQPPSAIWKLVRLGIRHQRPAALFDARSVNGGKGELPAKPVLPWKLIVSCRHKGRSNRPQDIAEWPHHAMLTLRISPRGVPNRPWHGICTILRGNMNEEGWCWPI
jgi:hypothetical protein